MTRYSLEKALASIDEVIEEIGKREYVEFIVFDVERSYEYDAYFGFIPHYTTRDPYKIFKRIARFRDKCRVIDEFLDEELFEIIKRHVPGKIKRVMEEVRKIKEKYCDRDVDVEVKLKDYFIVRVPSEEILEALKKLRERVKAEC